MLLPPLEGPDETRQPGATWRQICCFINLVLPLDTSLICGILFCFVCWSQPYWTCVFLIWYPVTLNSESYHDYTDFIDGTLSFCICLTLFLIRKNFSEYKFNILHWDIMWEHVKKKFDTTLNSSTEKQLL